MAFFDYTENNESSIIEDILTIVRRNIKFIIITFLLILAAVYGSLLYMTNQYESYALLMVQLGRENTEVPITVDNGGVFASGVQKEEINSYVNLLSSRTLIETALDEIGEERFSFEAPPPETLFQHLKYYVKSAAKWSKTQLEEGLILTGLKNRMSERAKIITLIERSLSVARERDSNIIRISLRLPDPALAQLTIQTLIDKYHEKHVSIRQTNNIQAAFNDQSLVYKDQLMNKRNEIISIMNTWNITSVEEQRAELIKNVHKTKYAMSEKETLKQELITKRPIILQQIEQEPSVRKEAEVFNNGSEEAIREELAKLRIRQINAQNRYSQNSKMLEIINEEIQEMEQLLSNEREQQSTSVTFQPNPRAENLRNQIKEIDSKVAGLNAAIQQDLNNIKRFEDEIRRLDQGSNLLTVAELEYSVLETKYLSSASRLEQAKIALALDAAQIANISTVAAANLPTVPVAPKRLLLLVIGAVVALIAGVGLALLREWLSDIVHEERDIISLDGVKFLGHFEKATASNSVANIS
ncbi:GumC family protein [Glaciecola sp. 1036]|uniref:GumC family protein n=1 Tax=Alteromonadaceae TaxID=72275 RepID=UPI003D032779